MQFTTKVTIFGSLYRYRFRELADEQKLKTVLKLLRDAAESRNDLLHGQISEGSRYSVDSILIRARSSEKSNFGIRATWREISKEWAESLTVKFANAYVSFSDFAHEEFGRVGYTTIETRQPKTTEDEV